jgi:PAX-interacting protein 1
MFSEIFDSADVAFRNTIKGIPEPRTIWETIREWDTCVRRAVVEFSQRLGGGTFSSRYGGWETLGGA